MNNTFTPKELEQLNQTRQSSLVRQVIPLTHWNKYHPYPTVSALRQLVFHAEINGFSMCIRRVGRRILIDESLFFQWVDETNAKGGV
jgi:hypothetical protein